MARWCASPRPTRRDERALILDHYEWSGGREAMLRFGPDSGPVVVVALPLFEEANRTRAFAVTICRALAKRGVASVLPDLPGQGESLIATEHATLDNWRQAFAAAAGADACYTVAIRSGALLDGLAEARGRWHLCAQDGTDLVRDLRRIHAAGGASSDGDPLEIAGNRIDLALLTALQSAVPSLATRTVRLDTDPKPADRHVPGAPLWRRAEPGNDPALAALLADDIAVWIATCEG